MTGGRPSAARASDGRLKRKAGRAKCEVLSVSGPGWRATSSACGGTAEANPASGSSRRPASSCLALSVRGGMLTRRHPDLMEYLLEDGFWNRFTANRFGRKPEWHKPFLLYRPPLAVGVGLWIAFWPSPVLRRWVAPQPAGMKQWLSDHPEAVFLALWLLMPLVVLFLVPSRLPLYVLPLMPIPALAMVRGLAARHGDPGPGRPVRPRLRRVGSGREFSRPL